MSKFIEPAKCDLRIYIGCELEPSEPYTGALTIFALRPNRLPGAGCESSLE